MSPDDDISSAYAGCLRIAREHYENFPVASRFIPAELRPHVAAVYAFARAADDMADEGSLQASERLEQLHDWRSRLIATERGHADHPVFLALAHTMRRYDIPAALFHDLLDAFEQDVTIESYATFDDVLAYCRKSANPVGRILLALFGLLNDRTAPSSDALCTGLQLANFWQDVSVDARKPRVYIPEEDLLHFGVSTDDIRQGRDSQAVRSLIGFEVERTRRYFDASTPLLGMVPFRIRLELKAVWHGGMRVLDTIERRGCDTVVHRPALSRSDQARVLLRAFLPAPGRGSIAWMHRTSPRISRAKAKPIS